MEKDKYPEELGGQSVPNSEETQQPENAAPVIPQPDETSDSAPLVSEAPVPPASESPVTPVEPEGEASAPQAADMGPVNLRKEAGQPQQADIPMQPPYAPESEAPGQPPYAAGPGVPGQPPYAAGPGMPGQPPYAAGPGMPGGAPAVPKKAKAGIIALLCIIAVLVIAILVVFVSGVTAPDPVDAVDKAIHKTEQALTAQSQKIFNEVPVMRAMSDVSPQAQKIDFDFSIQSIDDGTGSFESQMISNMLKGSGLKGTYVIDPQASIAELDGNIHYADMDLIRLYLFSSPDNVAFGIPTFSDTVFSINPKTMVEDYTSGPLAGTSYISMYDLQELQAALNMQSNSLNFAAQLDQQKIAAEVKSILGNFMKDAQYEKVKKVDGKRVYTVHLSGAQVKETLVALASYIYVDSEIATLYEGIFPPEMLDGLTFPELMEREIVTPLRQNLPELPATAVFTIGKDGVISNVNVTLDEAVGLPDSHFSIAGIHLDYTLDENRNASLTGTVDMTSYGEKATIDMVMKENYQDGAYEMNVEAGMEASGDGLFHFDISMLADQDGTCNIAFGVNDGDDGYIDLSVNVEGNYSEQDGTQTWDFPVLNLGVDSYGSKMNLGFALKTVFTPLAGGYEPALPSKPLFSMSESELEAEMAKHETGAENLMNSLFGMGSAPATPSPATPDFGGSSDEMTDEELEALLDEMMSAA